MPYRPEIHHRQTIRFPGHDYRSNGHYHVIINTLPGVRLGALHAGTIVLNPYGLITKQSWERVELELPYLCLDAWRIMPDHLHLLIEIKNHTQEKKPLGGIIGMFKTISTKAMNELDSSPGQKRWHRNFYEKWLVHPNEIHRTRIYIINNPLKEN